jgi:hypothetical protein
VLSLPYEWPDGGPAPMLARLAELRYRAAVVGPCGSGKTTLLDHLEGQLTALGFRVLRLTLHEGDRPFSSGVLKRWSATLGPTDLVCFDGAEQVGRARWMWFSWCTRRAGGVIITTHTRGRLPTLIECEATPELLHRIMRRLVPHEHVPPPSTARDLFARHHGNVREALRELYDTYSVLPTLDRAR